ncbi:cyclin-dependent protein kinase inhibitor SMR3 [Artemisia annua]|uniref:Cyclin-dependent protein kinase inhibitor SMR3 n=1 Tax=Artemisia annua TaxID=35608 RepID=A0A2U1PAW5_ARTAN|nr:cyclin-dependent protein kinase inhibitor SMR3 [Artemisia annua]
MLCPVCDEGVESSEHLFFSCSVASSIMAKVLGWWGILDSGISSYQGWVIWLEEVNEDDEPTTPKSSDQKIPIITTCPPAPRKPRSVPMNNKRKTPSFSRISVDLMVMFNAAMCDPVEEDIDSSERVKKVKKMDVITGEL